MKRSKPSDAVILKTYDEIAALGKGGASTLHMVADRLGCDYGDASEWVADAFRRQEQRRKNGGA